MKLPHKLFCITLSTLAFSLAACSDKKPSNTDHQASPTQDTATAQGNWQAKANTLSTANASDIKSDLTALNQTTNKANSAALKLRDDAQKAANDPEKIKHVLKESNDLQNDLQKQIMNLNLKSSEVQNIRTQMIDNLMTSNQLYALSTRPDFSLDAPSEEFMQLSKRSMAMQQKIGADLDALNAKYAK